MDVLLSYICSVVSTRKRRHCFREGKNKNSFIFSHTSTVISLPATKPYPVVKWSVLWAIFTLDKIIHNFLLM